MLEDLTQVHFSQHLNETFRIGPEDEAINAVLTEAKLLGSGGSDETRAPFSLVFRGPIEPALPQGTYEVTNDAMGTLEIFLVPIGTSEAGMRYEAVFN